MASFIKEQYEKILNEADIETTNLSMITSQEWEKFMELRFDQFLKSTVSIMKEYENYVSVFLNKLLKTKTEIPLRNNEISRHRQHLIATHEGRYVQEVFDLEVKFVKNEKLMETIEKDLEKNYKFLQFYQEKKNG